MNDIRKILVPTDFSECAAAAADAAVDLARRGDAELVLLHVIPPAALYYTGPGFAEMPFDWRNAAESGAREGLANESRRLAWPKIHTVLREGIVHDVILEEARTRKVDLIVSGTHGRRGIAHALLGSVAERIVRLSPVPVLTVRHPRK
jgi:nucleotide-binding universal stress UspA family protein